MESAFEGPITVSPPTPYGHSPVSWLDIVTFAKTNPEKFHLTTNSDGERTCHFSLNGVQVQILEDDWRFIVTGALDRFSVVPSSPLPEDETAELATLDIVEKRLQVLIKKADEVAKKARQLNYHLSGRKAMINSRRQTSQSASLGFQSLNSPQRHGAAGPSYDLHTDLLQQFQSSSSQSLTSRGSLGSGLESAHMPHHTLGPAEHRLPPINPQPNRSPLPSMSGLPHREPFDPSMAHRPVITSRIEKLARGDAIFPPCDRCRRLKTPCIKHLTACQGCTKKHAKCAWKTLTDDELTWLEREGSSSGDAEHPISGASLAHSTGSRYDPTHDEPRHSADESVGSRGEGSRPGSRGTHHAFAPPSPGENGHQGTQRHSDGYMDLAHKAVRSPSRPWEREAHHRNEHPGPPRELALMGLIASTASATTDARDGRSDQPSTQPGP